MALIVSSQSQAGKKSIQDKSEKVFKNSVKTKHIWKIFKQELGLFYALSKSPCFASKMETFILPITLILNTGYKNVGTCVCNFGVGNF